ncbi:hypothetical protein [Amycolatopsis sp. NPDC051716]|uniref:hypothetical protein n=1 Tax=Amycolatopsis sp. NPDC051716 TaxID=3155804 RepID=UPI00342D4143
MSSRSSRRIEKVLGFSDQANLDDGTMWAAGFALTEVTPAAEKRIAALVTQAVK